MSESQQKLLFELYNQPYNTPINLEIKSEQDKIDFNSLRDNCYLEERGPKYRSVITTTGREYIESIKLSDME